MVIKEIHTGLGKITILQLCIIARIHGTQKALNSAWSKILVRKIFWKKIHLNYTQRLSGVISARAVPIRDAKYAK
jgi:hypothetical protein